MNSVIVHYHEIALKGNNRPWFVSRLVRNLRAMTSDLDILDVRPLMGRIELLLGPKTDWTEVRERVSRAFGVANFARATRVRPDFDVLADRILSELAGYSVSSFRITARRADKRFPMTSPEIERALGARVQKSTLWRVDLSHPELTIQVEVLPSEIFFSFEKEKGAGGLPSGTSGRVVCLLSGGIDSPVAAYRMMKRGCSIIFVHFHSYPILSQASQEKVRQIVTRLTEYQLRSRLYMVPFGPIQQRVVVGVPPRFRVVVYRRLMLRIAERLARIERARAVVTGEVVGQVASQTLENLAVIGSVARLPVLRPLIGCDKEEIAAEAARIETYAVSIVPDQDCCQLFVPRHPSTGARADDLDAAESGLPLEEFVSEAVSAATVERFEFPGVKYSAQPQTGWLNSEQPKSPR